MKLYRSYLLSVLALGVLVPFTQAEKEMRIRRLDGDGPRPGIPAGEDGIEKEKVTFLGVETVPASRTLSAQLGLVRDTGLVVTHVLENSPASAVLKEDDVLIRLDDQLLINMPQLGVLVRSKKEGDEIKLTIMRAGKEISAKAKLIVREMPKLANAFFEFNGPRVNGFDRLRELPGMGPEGARDVMRMIERERGNSVTGPRVRVMGRAGRDSTLVDLPKSNVFYSDDAGSIEIKADDGKRSVILKNSKGEIDFTGPIDTEEERSKLSPEILQRLGKLETDTMRFEYNDDLHPEVIPLPPEAGATRIIRELGHHQMNRPGQPASSF
jgi:serine protease Do